MLIGTACDPMDSLGDSALAQTYVAYTASASGADPWGQWPWLESGAPLLRWLPVALWVLAALAWRQRPRHSST